ncbi:hypothetical protein H1P_6500008 [Hyella patelloides LEGE 07179]|uniref:Uncharacterized protein n=1 Tax=Hyella patelloides LEGE 07179 TaxID=945734 RepID=A0A563W2V6_9CYAN|nr:hypothetical protein [Hyella patelloides]VEP17873.1 hypothetical protein H1P_6500008 [Hyella patelloides LEGE 07179]
MSKNESYRQKKQKCLNNSEFITNRVIVRKQATTKFPISHTNLGSWLTLRVNMIPFDYQCPNHKKKDLRKEFSVNYE